DGAGPRHGRADLRIRPPGNTRARPASAARPVRQRHRVGTGLDRMRSVTDDLYQDVRESISELRTRVSERGLPATVREYIDAYEDRQGLTVDVHGEDVARDLHAWLRSGCCASFKKHWPMLGLACYPDS